MKKYLLIIFILFLSIWLISQDSPTKKDVEKCLIENLKECLTTKILSFKILDIDSNIVKIEFTLEDPMIYYMKVKKDNHTWVILEFSRDKSSWMKAEEFFKGAKEECKKRNEKVETRKKRKIEDDKRKIEDERMKKENPQKYTIRQLKSMYMALLSYETDYGKFPEASSIKELAKILSPFYINTLPLKDAWDENFTYKRINSKKFLIISKGPDKKLNTDDDISIDQDAKIKKSKQK